MCTISQIQSALGNFLNENNSQGLEIEQFFSIILILSQYVSKNAFTLHPLPK